MTVTRRERRAGILLHPSSLPGAHGIGDLGAAARRFVDWLASAGQTLWQVLPLGPVGPGNSPYMSDSAFAGNPLLIDLDALVEAGWLPAERLAGAPAFAPDRTDYFAARAFKTACLDEAAAGFAADFAARPASTVATEFTAFRRANATWAEDYALFAVLEAEHGAPWTRWPPALRRRDPGAIDDFRRSRRAAIDAALFVQWCFDRQWQALKREANARGIELVGDMPIYVAHHSAEVWANPALFELDADGEARVIAGVPPDYFSETGQRWGNPLYRWPAHAAEAYSWWKARLRHALHAVDRLRIDHFRGFEAYWEIPAAAETAVDGQWRAGPGDAFFVALREALGPLPVIAEDLGIITDAVNALRQRHGLPGMRVLHFAFDGHAENPYLPHNHTADSVVYTGTHDNDTSLGWWQGLGEAERDRVRAYLGSDGTAIHWDLIRTAYASVADIAIVPMQDVLGLGAGARMNTPGTAEACWTWRLDEAQIEYWQAPLLADMARRYGRPLPHPKP